MPVQTSYPGVYVQEAPSGVHAISGVATSVAAFVGMCPSGPVNVPTRIFSYREFEGLFGGAAVVGEMPDQVRQFFLNGGSQAWIVRNAKGATDGANLKARSTLLAEDFTQKVLIVTAKDAGSDGNLIRVEIDYATDSPERTFNLTVFLALVQSNGITKRDAETTYRNLSMDPASPRFAPRIVSEESDLIDLAIDPSITTPTVPVTPVGVNLSQSGLIFSDLPAFVTAEMAGPADRMLMVSVANRPAVAVNLLALLTTNIGAVCQDVEDRINTALADAGETTTVSVDHTTVGPGEVLQISSTNGPVVIQSAQVADVAALLQLGVANGGLETDGYSARRPAANGYVTKVHSGASLATAFGRAHNFAAVVKSTLGNIGVTGAGHLIAPVATALTGPAIMAADPAITLAGVAGSFAAVTASLSVIVTTINANAADQFIASVQGLRLRVLPLYGNQDADLTLNVTASGPSTLTGAGEILQVGSRPTNAVRYGIGLALPPAPVAAPGGAYRADRQAGIDGDPPELADYDYSWDKLARTADIFNLLVLPRAKTLGATQDDAARKALWGPASAVCQRNRSFLIVDPPSEPGAGAWHNANAAAAGVQLLRSGIVTDHAAIYWPRVRTTDAKGKPITIDPAGTMAGVYAKTDVRRGIWKAPAGLEASLTGVSGLEYAVTNPENGLTNPQALNTLRSMVSGATSWGARTMMGYDGAPDQDYRYVPVRRLALYIEESLYRGLQFAVFEPNAEPLWGQIRLAAGSFMNGLFRQGAFKGEKKSDAYFVACGPSTTTPTDINLGIVNVDIGFSPLKPGEFIVITVRQMAGQIEI